MTLCYNKDPNCWKYRVQQQQADPESETGVVETKKEKTPVS
jgi:hypothetical protein